MVREFEKEKEETEGRHSHQLQTSLVELATLKRQHELQQKETAHVKKLARQLLDQRTELEQFFLDSLAHVKKEIADNRYVNSHHSSQSYKHNNPSSLKKYIIILM